MRNDVAAGMQALCENVITGYRARKIALAFVRDESNTIRGDERLFIGQRRIFQRRQVNALRKELAEYRKAMVPTVQVFLKTCRHRRAETRSDFLGAGRAWRAMTTELKHRRAENHLSASFRG